MPLRNKPPPFEATAGLRCHVVVAAAGCSWVGRVKNSAAVTPAATTAPAVVKKNPWYPDHAVFSATKDQLKSMPEFKYSTE